MSKRLNHEGSFTKRKDGRWQGQIQLDKERYYVYGSTRSEVQDKLQELLERHTAGLTIKPHDYTVSEWTTLWLNDFLKTRIRPNSYLQQEGLANKHIVPELGSIPLQKLSTLHIQHLVRRKLESSLSPSTVQKIRNTIYAMAQYAVDTGILMRNPAKMVSVKKSKSKEPQTLTVKQTNALLNTGSGHPLYPALLLLITTGLRRSELCGLKWSDINWPHSTAYIQRVVVKNGGYAILVQDTKTDSSRRLIPLHDLVIDALRLHQKNNPDTEYIFSRPDGQPIYPEVIYDFIKRLGKKIGIPSITVHMLRHTAASLLLVAGEHPKVVQELLGHSSIGITMDIYSHVIPGMKQQAVTKLASMVI